MLLGHNGKKTLILELGCCCRRRVILLQTCIKFGARESLIVLLDDFNWIWVSITDFTNSEINLLYFHNEDQIRVHYHFKHGIRTNPLVLRVPGLAYCVIWWSFS